MKLLISTQLAFNVGFYMVLPYLATHLAEDLGLAAARFATLSAAGSFPSSTATCTLRALRRASSTSSTAAEPMGCRR